MKFLGFIPRVLNFFNEKISRRRKPDEGITVSNSRYKIHIFAQGFINRDRQLKKEDT